MKKPSLVVALPALAIAVLMLSSCGMFRSHKQWQTAQQESPLEIPPGLDTPSTSAALVIPPPGANAPTAEGATAQVGDKPGSTPVIADAFVLSDSVDNTYHRVSQTLEAGDIGQVTAHDDTAHTFNLNVTASPLRAKKPGLFGRMFGHGASDNSKDADSAGAATYPVQVTVDNSGDKASEVRAQGNAAAVAKVIDSLKSRLGG